jgi:hypothetical protein
MKYFNFIFLISFSILILRPNVTGQNLIAHYPLNSNPNDTTGLNDPMELINTPYQEGGIYCNGIYYGNSGYCHAITPQLGNFNFNSFAITVNFKVSEYPEPGPDRPVFVGGDLYRWIQFGLRSDSTVSLRYNNGLLVPSKVKYSLNTWYQATIIYDSSTKTGSLYLDNELACTAQFELFHGNDANIGITNFGSGTTFKGWLSDLRIYDYSPVGVEDDGQMPELFGLKQNYPNPFNPSTNIEYSITNFRFVVLKVYDILGREVAILVNEEKQPGVYEISFDASGLSSGIYYYLLESGGSAETKKMVLLR